MNVAILGCGGMGRLHAQMATNCGLRISYCADAVRKAAKGLADDFGAKAVVDPMKAIEAKDTDIVVITTPTPSHETFVSAAAAAGKHIFCEKPFGRSSEECKRAIRAAEKAGVTLFVGHVVRYFQEFELMRERIQKGSIGKTGWVKLFRGGIFPGAPGSWFRDYKQSGGVTFDCMIHDLDWVRYVFGEPERIFCQTIMRTEPTQLDYSQVTMRMKSGVIATIINTWAAPSGFKVKAEICGSKGMIQFDSTETPLGAEPRQTGSGPTMFVPMSPVAVSPYQLEWQDFIATIGSGHTPRVTPLDALRAVEMAEAALKSNSSKEPVKF
ncbi:MAG TPA: Gfo/Idh/MocA family oxidoreductase [Candidatus Hydrogenedentes bacterium]|jgi:predicted dehydrogenase|nr:MAG: Inositol 2-dehydrogenase [Candidatus Hydrogenedentes bacterium ADurb.Bin170]HNZ47265.1 Gfo/Idh/MocA family oxidoreductase [Candidatus Hydrogenedentota bacterium]HOH42981.1 Gfo/Idh/MocA family oxidoreductase [Candidatus Hydrogenedentota bacterium]HPX87119.1 Gfo/Idh/MocA family oxidoreductase [Candidatus Hydrogenedentota bacterium]HQB03118.1 Gfo/Idh/MocA family oxidoreductase [Candidatus Hydrogenedentota bacterium]